VTAPPYLTFTVVPVTHLAVGGDPTSAYAEECWLPTIGPTALLIARRVAQLIGVQDRLVLETGALARALGVFPPVLMNSIDRLVRYQLAAWVPGQDNRLALASHWPTAPPRAVAAHYHLRPMTQPERNTNGDDSTGGG
jgi:hypothetical protein